MNKGLIILTIIIALIILYVGFKGPVTQTYNPIQIAMSPSIQVDYLEDLKTTEEVSISIEVPKEIPKDEPAEVFNEIPEPKPEMFGFLDTKANIFNQTILAGYYLNNCANAQRAAELIQGTVIQPNETFSFNKVVGSRTVSRGFTEGKIIVGNRYEPGVGGGVCRTSTALHQAARQAGLKINEVHRHSLPIGYAQRGQDAAVWYNTKDLKITNTKDYPVKILTIDTEGKLYIAVAVAENTKEDKEVNGREMHDMQKTVPEGSFEGYGSHVE